MGDAIQPTARAGVDHDTLSDAERGVLVDLLSEPKDDAAGVDAVVFRARHASLLTILDQLEDDRLIRREQERYLVSLLALVRLDIEPAKRVLGAVEVLFRELKSRYQQDPRRPVDLEDLAKATALSIEDTRLSLRFMLENSTWCSGLSGPLTRPGASILITEQVLRHETFAGLIDQLEEWRAIALRQRHSWHQLNASRQGTDIRVQGNASASTGSRPPWFGSLPPNIADLMGEVYAGIEIGLRGLPSMGIRAVLDLLFAKMLNGDQGGFAEKVKALCSSGQLSSKERDHVMAVIDAGNASAHRGHLPDQGDVQTILVVCERLLEREFVLQDATKRLKTNTPPRSTPKRHTS